MRQTLLTPVAAELGREDGALLLENLPLLEQLGFACEDFGDGAVLVRESAPRWLMQLSTINSFIAYSSSYTDVTTGFPSRSSKGVRPPALPLAWKM